MGFLKVSVPKLSPFTSKLRQRQKNKSLQSLATLVNFLVAGVRLELTTFGLWARRAANCSTPRCLDIFYYTSFILILSIDFENLAKIVRWKFIFSCILYAKLLKILLFYSPPPITFIKNVVPLNHSKYQSVIFQFHCQDNNFLLVSF